MLLYILKKEFRLIFRDMHALLVLFLMPLAFILIMSVALKNTYTQELETKLRVAINSELNHDIKVMLDELNKNQYFEVVLLNQNTTKELLYENGFDFVVVLDSEFKQKIIKNSKELQLLIFSKPDIKSEFYYILKSEIVKDISKYITKEFYIEHKIDAKTLDNLDNLIKNEYIFRDKKDSKKLNSTQQSVPAWLVFSMFFILIPISNTFISEKNFGTLQRIRSIDAPLYLLFVGKFLPYFVINQLQLIIMLMVGRYIVPLFGASALSLDINLGLLFLASFAISFCAIAFALLVANISKTTEMATSIGGVANIIFAALAGVMVPKLIMPKSMQSISEYSPMSWAVDSFSALMLGSNNLSDISMKLVWLMLFGIICFFISYILLSRREL